MVFVNAECTIGIRHYMVYIEGNCDLHIEFNSMKVYQKNGFGKNFNLKLS